MSEKGFGILPGTLNHFTLAVQIHLAQFKGSEEKVEINQLSKKDIKENKSATSNYIGSKGHIQSQIQIFFYSCQHSDLNWIV
jgi:hypothetical protein